MFVPARSGRNWSPDSTAFVFFCGSFWISPLIHVMRTVSRHRGLFLFAILDKQRTNLALARYKLMEAEQSLE